MNIVPTLADIHLKLSEHEVQHGNLLGTVTILSEGLAIEQSQYVNGSECFHSSRFEHMHRLSLQQHVKALGSTSSPTQWNELLDKQHRLEARIIAYEQWISVIMKLDDNI